MPDLLLNTVSKKIADGNLAGALQDLNRAVQASPDAHLILFHRGRLHIRMHNFEQALADLDAAIQAGVATADALNQRSLAKIQLQDFQGAIADGQHAAQLDPENYQNYLYQGLAYFNMGHYAASIPCFSAALERFSTHHESQRLRGMAYCLTNQYPEGLADIERVLQQFPNDDQAWFWLGYIRQHQGLTADALDALSQSITLNAYNKSAYVSRGRIHLEQGDQKKALADFLTAKTLDPDWDILPTLIHEAQRTEGRGGIFGAWRELKEKGNHRE